MQFTLQTFFLLFVVLWSSLGVFAVAGLAAFVAVLWLAIGLHWPRTFIATFFTGITLLGMLVALLLPAQSTSREFARRNRCEENLCQIAIALKAYRTEHGRYPPQFSPDAHDRPMHSWRVLLLPYLGCKDVFNKYNFRQPWNSPANKALASQIPERFRCPTANPVGTETNYVALTGPGTAWNENIGPDSASQLRPEQLILLIEVQGSGIDWMEPRDSTPADNRATNGEISRTGLGSPHFGWNSPLRPAGHIVCADGSVRLLRNGIVTEIPPGALTVGSTDQVDWRKLDAPILSQPRLPHSTWTRLAALPIWLLSVGIFLFRAWRSRIAAT